MKHAYNSTLNVYNSKIKIISIWLPSKSDTVQDMVKVVFDSNEKYDSTTIEQIISSFKETYASFAIEDKKETLLHKDIGTCGCCNNKLSWIKIIKSWFNKKWQKQ